MSSGMGFYPLVALNRAHPLTALIAERVKLLRDKDHRNLSGTELAKRLRAVGIPWTQTTVAKLESGARESVSVHELLALALVLGTTPLSLITDPRAGQVVPLAGDFSADPWLALLWCRGDGHNDERDPRMRVDYDTWVVCDLAHAIADLCRRIVRPGEPGQDQDARDRSLLRLLVTHLDRAGKLGAAPYPVPAAVRARAAELGMPLTRDQPEDD